MTQTSAFKNPEGEAAYLAAYEGVLESWPVPYEEIEVPCQYGMTHVLTCGPEDGPPLVLLHGYLITLTMWLPNISDFSKRYRVYLIDVMGQPSKSIPNADEPIRNAAGFMTWLTATLDCLDLDKVSLVGMSFGGWMALKFALTAPERVEKLVLLSPAASLQPIVGQFALRGMLMGIFPSRLTVNSLMGWMGFKDTPGDPVTRKLLNLFYLGMKHFRLPPETMRIMPEVFSDEELRRLPMPVLVLIGENEVIYDARNALARARQLIPNFDGAIVPECSHDMCSSQYQTVDARVLDFLNEH